MGRSPAQKEQFAAAKGAKQAAQKAAANKRQRSGQPNQEKRRCMHAHCGRTAKGLVMIRKAGWQQTLHAIGLKMQRQGKQKWYVCPAHLKDPEKPPSAGNVRAFVDDPICMGTTKGRNPAGDEFARRFEEHCEKQPPRTTRTSDAASDIDELLEKMWAMQARLLAQDRELAAHRAAPVPFSWRWLLCPKRGQRIRVMAGSTRQELCHLRACLDAAGAEDGYVFMYKRDHPRSDPPLNWADALALAIVRVFKIRNYDVASEFCHIEPKGLGECAQLAAFVASKVYRETWGRPFGEVELDLIEEQRVPALGTPEFVRVQKIMDGFKLGCVYPSQAKEHRAMHSAYVNGSVAQSSLTVNQAFELDSRTKMYAGSWGESTCVIADGKHRANPYKKEYNPDGVLADMRPKSVLMTDKGYNLVEHMRKEFDGEQIKPTECTKSSGGAGMSEGEGARSRRLAAPRAVSERAVGSVKRFDYCSGKPIRMEEWAWMEEWMDLIFLIVKFDGPFPDHTPPTVEDEVDAADGGGEPTLCLFTVIVKVASPGQPDGMPEFQLSCSLCCFDPFVVDWLRVAKFVPARLVPRTFFSVDYYS